MKYGETYITYNFRARLSPTTLIPVSILEYIRIKETRLMTTVADRGG